MNKIFLYPGFLLLIIFASCSHEKRDSENVKTIVLKEAKERIIIDCDYTFDEAIAGSVAPEHILNQLQLIDVVYYSIDNKVHAGQILTNKKMVPVLKHMFEFMYEKQFPIGRAIPIVKFKWNDELSMQANNTYSFCYRNAGYSKHASGMAIDINPFFNPVRWKNGYQNRTNKPVGAIYNPKVPGTFYPENPVNIEFKKSGLRWGHSFTRNWDDHHFEK